jgi:pilus assembly protein Flp/PilA
MSKLMQGIERFWREEVGTEVVEWALVAGLIVAVGAGIFSQIGGRVSDLLTGLLESLNE